MENSMTKLAKLKKLRVDLAMKLAFSLSHSECRELFSKLREVELSIQELCISQQN